MRQEHNEGNQMSTWKLLVACSAACLAFSGCTSTNMPIIAGAIDTVGVSISGGAQDQGGTMVVGYRGAKFAVVPVETSKGDQLLLTDKAGNDQGFSVFAMLGLDVKGSTSPCVGVSQVVAVGPAATAWADKGPSANGC
jgi:hypothetical protein